MRVGILALLQESNTFLREPTTLERFRENLLVVGEAIRRDLEPAHHEVGGFFAGLAEEGIEAVPLFAARALPYGVVTADAFDALLAMMAQQVEQAGPLAGILVAPHGATVSERYPDADGQWLFRLRQWVGPRCPLIGTLDPHANLSRQMVESTNALVAYRTNPHLDQRQRGIEAARLMARTVRGEIQPTQAAAFPPMAINIECQLTSAPPCLPLYQQADRMLQRPGVLSNSIMLGFPYADVAEMGSAVLVVTDNNPAAAQGLAEELATAMWSAREEFVGRLLSIQQAVAQARSLAGPICLLDMGDNVGGGSPGDGTLIAHALQERPVGEAFVCLDDAAAVREAEKAGVGSQVRLRVGGKSDDRHGPPLEATFTVRSLHDGRFEEAQPRHGGLRAFDQGRTAIVRTEQGLTVMLTSRRMVPFSLAQLTSCGLDPSAFHVLVVKGVIAPVAAYAPVCKQLLRVNTPGVTTADMVTLPYKHRRRPMFPFERDCSWKAQA